MLNLVKAEWIKLRSVRVNIVLSCLASAFPIVIVVLVALLDGSPERQKAENVIGLITGTMVVTALLVGVIGALNLTGEFSHGTIRNTFAATPQRRNVLLAKAFVGFTATVAFALAVAAICYVVGPAIYESRGASLTFEGYHRSALLGIVLLSGLLSLLGFGLGLLIRNSPATVVAFVLWPLLLEGLVALVLNVAGVNDSQKWLPYQSAIQMGDPSPEGDVNRWSGGLYLGAVVTVMIIVGILVNERRDA